ncbi:MAG: hypothetical protein LBR36_06845 [Bacteroidales bacterium]|jgi:hypothetical protein|nr:hypothetical protein [Bacteroidales bacterium]
MKKTLYILLLIFGLANFAFSQEEINCGMYSTLSVAYTHDFLLNKSLKDLGTQTIPAVSISDVIGLAINYKHLAFTLDYGVGFMAKKKIVSASFLTNALLGYQLSLPKEQSLIFAGNISYELYGVRAFITKGDIDLKNNTLSSTTYFALLLHQLRIGPKITYHNKDIDISIGYDFGCIPLRWQSSENVNVTNSPKERTDKVYISLTTYFKKF